jgi:hypothetical protein
MDALEGAEWTTAPLVEVATGRRRHLKRPPPVRRRAPSLHRQKVHDAGSHGRRRSKPDLVQHMLFRRPQPSRRHGEWGGEHAVGAVSSLAHSQTEEWPRVAEREVRLGFFL